VGVAVAIPSCPYAGANRMKERPTIVARINRAAVIFFML